MVKVFHTNSWVGQNKVETLGNRYHIHAFFNFPPCVVWSFSSKTNLPSNLTSLERGIIGSLAVSWSIISTLHIITSHYLTSLVDLYTHGGVDCCSLVPTRGSFNFGLVGYPTRLERVCDYYELQGTPPTPSPAHSPLARFACLLAAIQNQGALPFHQPVSIQLLSLPPFLSAFHSSSESLTQAPHPLLLNPVLVPNCALAAVTFARASAESLPKWLWCRSSH